MFGCVFIFIFLPACFLAFFTETGPRAIPNIFEAGWFDPCVCRRHGVHQKAWQGGYQRIQMAQKLLF